MWRLKISYCLVIGMVLINNTIEARSSACEQKEKHFIILDLAKESISKAKVLQPTCDNDEKDMSSNVSKCGVKEKVSAYLDVAIGLIEEAKKNYTACDVPKNIADIILLHKKPSDCLEILENGYNTSGVYTIWPKLQFGPLKVYCDMDTDGGGWTMIQRRGQFSEKIDFYRNWNNYKVGFGNISEEFWIGNENIFALTNQGNYSVRFDMQTVNKIRRYAEYSSFWTEDESNGYRLHFENYIGTAGDGMTTEKNIKFSTKDRKNDKSLYSCSDLRKGGWWYSDCGNSNPNGINLPGSKVEDCVWWKCMNWEPLTSESSLLAIEIKIKPEK